MRDRWRHRKGEKHAERQGKACRQRDTETRRGGDREVINGVVMPTLVSGQGFESLNEWKKGYHTLLLLSLLQIDEKTKAK